MVYPGQGHSVRWVYIISLSHQRTSSHTSCSSFTHRGYLVQLLRHTDMCLEGRTPSRTKTENMRNSTQSLNRAEDQTEDPKMLGCNPMCPQTLYHTYLTIHNSIKPLQLINDEVWNIQTILSDTESHKIQ